MKYYCVTNLQRYQHYKQRKPAWVKQHWDFWNDSDLNVLPLGHRLVALGLVQVASREHAGIISGNIRELARQLAVTPRVIQAALVSLENIGFITSLDSSIALERKRSSISLEPSRALDERTETETEVKTTAVAKDAAPDTPNTLNGKTHPELAAQLADLGWQPTQIAQGLQKPELAEMWVTASATANNPGGYAWHGFQNGTPPSPDQLPRKVDIMHALRLEISGHGWDEATDEAAMRETFVRQANLLRSPLTTQQVDELAAEWHIERLKRYPPPSA